MDSETIARDRRQRAAHRAAKLNLATAELYAAAEAVKSLLGPQDDFERALTLAAAALRAAKEA